MLFYLTYSSALVRHKNYKRKKNKEEKKKANLKNTSFLSKNKNDDTEKNGHIYTKWINLIFEYQVH